MSVVNGQPAFGLRDLLARAEGYHADLAVLRAASAEIARARDDARTSALLGAEWFEAGLPRIVLGHRHAASLMMTRVPAEIAAGVRPPWPAFLVDVPNGLLVVDSEHYGHVEVTRAVIAMTASGLIITYGGDECFVAIARGFELARLADVEFDGCPASTLLARYLFGVLLEIDAHRPGRGGGGGRVRRKHGQPVTRTFTLTRNVRVDCRDLARAYARGGTGTAPAIQYMVRGHWKMQPCGPGGSERRYTRIEPYWRGPDEAPIALRSHALRPAGEVRHG